jgi:hypothetical protein
VRIELADHPGPVGVGKVVELLLQLVLDDRPLLLDDEDFSRPRAMLVGSSGHGMPTL